MKDKKIKECQIFWIQEIACSQEDIGQPIYTNYQNEKP